MSTLTATKTLTVLTCGDCGVTFAMDNEFILERQKDHKAWYCPNGCRRYYPGKNDLEIERERREGLERELTREMQRRHNAEDAAAQAQRERSAARGVITRIRNRVARGVCPCCNRTFNNLARHMESKHPEYPK